jgi:hypothetical protein
LPPAGRAPAVADAAAKGAPGPQQILLTRKGTDVLVRLERLLDEASRALPPPGVPPGPLGAIERRGGTSTQTAASEPPSAPTRP